MEISHKNQHLPRVEKRKLWKKQRRKKIRQKNAKDREATRISLEDNPEELRKQKVQEIQEKQMHDFEEQKWIQREIEIVAEWNRRQEMLKPFEVVCLFYVMLSVRLVKHFLGILKSIIS